MTGQQAAAAGALAEAVGVYRGLFSKGTHKMIPAAPFPRTRSHQDVQSCLTELPNGIRLIPSETQIWEDKKDSRDYEKK